MKPQGFFFLILLIVALPLSTLTGCEDKEPATLKVALLPIVDVLPAYVAERNGYLAAEGIQVELVPVKSAQENSALLQADEVDGTLTDLQGVGLFNQESPQVKVVAMARKAYPNAPVFRLLAAPGSAIDSPADLAGIKIGVSNNTVIEYITERMLQGSGLTADQIVLENIAAIPVRFEQLMNGQIQAATLPDPLASGAIAAGARPVIDDSQFTQYSQSVLIFTTRALEEKPMAIQKFLTAWNKAVADLNTDPDAYRDLLIQQGRVPESVQGSYAMPPFPQGEITSQTEWADVVRWLQDKGLLEREIPYQDAVDTRFLK